MHQQLWIVGISEGEIGLIEMNKGYSVPHPTQRSLLKTEKFQIPFLNMITNEKGEKSLGTIEEGVMRKNLTIEQELYRKDQWEHLKLFRTKYDNECSQTETILTNSSISNMKKEVDKMILDAIRISIVDEDFEKVLSYVD